MELVVHGTKGGYRVLFKTINAPSIASDIRNNESSETALGKSAYSIAFTKGGCVFTKYTVIRDTLRSDATGFIAFSLFLSSNKVLFDRGADIKSILDDLSGHYIDNYVRNNNINKGETDITQEDWSFVNNILTRKTEKDKNRRDIEVQTGTKEAAFIYYKNDFELQEYFSKPFQEEYNGYKSILLINGNSISNSSDLLNVLRNSGVELKDIDLTNEYFHLINDSRDRGLTIIADGKPHSNFIRAKWTVKLNYIKDYYEPINVEGTLSNLNSDIHRFLEIKDNQINIKYEVLCKYLVPKEKLISFDLRNYKNLSVINTEISCKNGEVQKIAEKNQITFKGEELGQQWTVSAGQGADLISNKKTIIPENENKVRLVLTEHKKVKFTGFLKESKQYFTDIRITVGGKKIDSDNTEIDFIDDEIGQPFHVIATYQRGNQHLSGQKSFRPNERDHVQIELQKVIQRKYKIDAGDHGKVKDGYQDFTINITGTDVYSHIKPNKCWKFIKFKLDDSRNKKDFDGILVAQYEKMNFFAKPLGIVFSILFVLVIIFGVWLGFSNSQPPSSQITIEEIKNYVQGDRLNPDTLNQFKDQWGSQVPKMQKADGVFSYFSNNEPQIDTTTTKYKEWEDVLNSIDSAKNKRNLIDSLDFTKLKGLYYYPKQENFKNIIVTIDSTRYDDLKTRLGDVYSWDLNMITDSINHIYNHQATDGEIASEQKLILINNEKQESPNEGIESSKQKQEKLELSSQTPTSNGTSSSENDKNREITKGLKNGSVSRQQLEEWQNAEIKQYKNSINIYLQFWGLVANSQKKNDFDILLKSVNKDGILKNSELKKFLESICANSEAFQKYNVAKGKATCITIDELREKIK